MKTLNYTLVDVFTTKPFGGNQLAVFEEESNLTHESMQMIARELNLSETVFIRKPNDPKKERRLSIFTPQVELPMAGHPTIGAVYVMAEKGMIETKTGINEWVFEEGVGDVPVTVEMLDNGILKVEMEQPLPSFGDEYTDRELAAKLLSLSLDELDPILPLQTVSSGVPFLYIPVHSLSAMKKINFRTDVWEKYFSENPNTKHIFTFTTETEEPQSTVHSRMFAPAMGISEDPATGAASGPLGAYLVKHGVVPSAADGIHTIRSEQGIEMGRPSFIDITVVKEENKIKKVKIGGKSIIMGTGQIYL